MGSGVHHRIPHATKDDNRIDQLENVLMQVVSQLQSMTPPAATAQSD
jgi:hypothetical protein